MNDNNNNDPISLLDIAFSQIRRDVQFAQFKVDSVIKLINNDKKSSAEEKVKTIKRILLDVEKELSKYN